MAEPKKRTPKSTSARAKVKSPASTASESGKPGEEETASPEATAAEAVADAEEAVEPSVDYEVVTPPPPIDPRRGVGVVIPLLFVAVAGIGIYATWPLWSPYVESRFPALAYKPAIDPRLAKLVGRLDALEAQTSVGLVKSATISDMEQERIRLQQEVGRLLERLNSIEETIKGVKDEVAAADAKGPTEDTQKALEDISGRLAELEKSGDNVDTLVERIDELENKSASGLGIAEKRVNETTSQLNSMIDKLEGRLKTLEGSGDAASAQSNAAAIILAVSQLRKSAVSGEPFEKDIETLRALAVGHPEMQVALLVLEKNAKTGTPTIVALRDQFAEVASSIIRADNESAGNSWLEIAKKRVLSLVSIRKLGGSTNTVSVDSLVGLAEDHLLQGDIAAAAKVIEELKAVSEPAAKVAEPWLQAAKNRLQAERAVASLHVYAVSLVAGGNS